MSMLHPAVEKKMQKYEEGYQHKSLKALWRRGFERFFWPL
jgi:hypothetical protein